jgi:glycosyltransferase involved in cell wall biosynthesis
MQHSSGRRASRQAGYLEPVPSTTNAHTPGVRPRVVLVRGHQANPWELGPWAHPEIAEHFEVTYLRSGRAWFDTGQVRLASRRAWTARDILPPGRIGDLAVRVPGDRYLAPRAALRGADIVHSQELGYWYSMQAAKLRQRLGFRLVLTVWETIPFLDAYRNIRTRGYRALTLKAADMFLAATERAKVSLLLEGAPADRIRVCPPGIATDRFVAPARRGDGAPLILSPGRLVWEKGHQDALRALALIRRGPPSGAGIDARLLIIGTGPEEGRLRAYAQELGVADAVEFRGFIPYDTMPEVYSGAACMVLASLATWSWEEQFGMVLAEGMAAGVPIVASSSGAIPEVAGAAARYFSPGDWIGLADALSNVLAAGAMAGTEKDERYSTAAAARRLAAAYREVLQPPDTPGHQVAAAADS